MGERLIDGSPAAAQLVRRVASSTLASCLSLYSDGCASQTRSQGGRSAGRVALVVLCRRFSRRFSMLRCSGVLAGSSREALSRWEGAWCDAMLEVLASPEPRLSANVSTYALSVPLAMESGSLITLLQRILAAAKASDGTVPDGQVSIPQHANSHMADTCAWGVPRTLP